MSKPNWRVVTGFLTCLIVLAAVNLSIAGKERLLAEGRVVYLQLAPVDPRSLMQGDYMALNYTVARSALRALSDSGPEDRPLPQPGSADGHIVVRLDDRSVASFARIADEQPLVENEILLRYRWRNEQLKFATNAFFFQEGTGETYQHARYGKFRVNPEGEMLLTTLVDDQLQPFGSKP